MTPSADLAAIARLDLAEVARSRWLVTCLAVYAVLGGVFVLVGLRESTVIGFTGMGRVLFSLCHALVLILPAALAWPLFPADWWWAPALPLVPHASILVSGAREAQVPDGPGLGALIRRAVFGFLQLLLQGRGEVFFGEVHRFLDFRFLFGRFVHGGVVVKCEPQGASRGSQHGAGPAQRNPRSDPRLAPCGSRSTAPVFFDLLHECFAVRRDGCVFFFRQFAQ